MKKLKKGMVFKNYREVFKHLGLEHGEGNTRIKNKKIFESFCNYTQDGNKITITEVYKTPKKIIDKRTNIIKKDNLNTQTAYLILTKLDCLEGVYLGHGYRVTDDLFCKNYTTKQIFEHMFSGFNTPNIYGYTKHKSKEKTEECKYFNMLMKTYIRKYIEYGLNYLKRNNIIKDLSERYICIYKESQNKEIANIIYNQNELYKYSLFKQEEYDDTLKEICIKYNIEPKNFFITDTEIKIKISKEIKKKLSKKYNTDISTIYKSWCFLKDDNYEKQKMSLLNTFIDEDICEIQESIINKLYENIAQQAILLSNKISNKYNDINDFLYNAYRLTEYYSVNNEDYFGDADYTTYKKHDLCNYVMYFNIAKEIGKNNKSVQNQIQNSLFYRVYMKENK